MSEGSPPWGAGNVRPKHQRVEQNFIMNHLRRSPNKEKSSCSRKFVIIPSQLYFGRPMRLCPRGCQTKTVLTQRCGSSVAKQCAKFRWCRTQIADHIFFPIQSEEFYGMVMPSPYCEEDPLVIGDIGDMQHPYCVNHCDNGQQYTNYR